MWMTYILLVSDKPDKVNAARLRAEADGSGNVSLTARSLT